jgi:hypothetical protein
MIAICRQFKMIAYHRYISVGFCNGTIVPVIKDKSRNLNDIENYRPITPIPIMSKIFEHVFMYLYLRTILRLMGSSLDLNVT